MSAAHGHLIGIETVHRKLPKKNGTQCRIDR